jgi:hypothetical protein
LPVKRKANGENRVRLSGYTLADKKKTRNSKFVESGFACATMVEEYVPETNFLRFRPK